MMVLAFVVIMLLSSYECNYAHLWTCWDVPGIALRLPGTCNTYIYTQCCITLIANVLMDGVLVKRLMKDTNIEIYVSGAIRVKRKERMEVGSV